MRRVIVESPFGNPDPALVERNLRYLRACLRDALGRGEAPFASHAVYTQPGILDDSVPAEREHGILAGFAWREMAVATIVYTDLGVSKGMVKGIEHAMRMRDDDGTHKLEFRTLGGEWAEQG